jgi:HNH endonuclease
MSELPDELRREIRRRDGYRCQECGIVVGKRNGCKPQIHHRKRRSVGGSDDQENLITLCLPDHSTKGSQGHRRLLEKARLDELPSYIKWSLWEIATELLVYAERLPAQKFPACNALKRLDELQGAINSVRQLTLTAIRENPQVAAYDYDEGAYETPEEIEAILRGVQISYWARHNQELLDEEVRGG